MDMINQYSSVQRSETVTKYGSHIHIHWAFFESTPFSITVAQRQQAYLNFAITLRNHYRIKEYEAYEEKKLELCRNRKIIVPEDSLSVPRASKAY